jgi:uncharacterized membrane protein
VAPSHICYRLSGLLSWVVPLFRATDPLRKNDVLASNLLFAILLLELCEHLFWVVIRYLYVSSEHNPLWPGSGIWLLVVTLLKAAFYLAIRRGMLRAKVVMLVVCAYLTYAGTHFHHGYFAGIYFNDPWGYSLFVLLKTLMTLAALVLMFKKPHIVAPSTSARSS